MQNWARNITFGAARIHRPTTLEEVTAIVAQGRKVRAVGSAHSFNDLADTDQDLISPELLDGVIDIDSEAATVTVEGGIRYHQLSAELDRQGWALPNLPSIPHFSVAGACATGTHGSGDGNRELAAAVASIELITADGGRLRINRGEPDFGAAVVSLGALGIVVRLTLDIEPAYAVAQELHLATPLPRAIAEVDEIMAEAYSVSWFLDWGGDTVNQIWRKYRLGPGETALPETDPGLRGGRRATAQLGLRHDSDPGRFTPQVGSVGPWHERLPHIRPEQMAPPGGELQSEYFVARAHGRAALEAVADIGPELASQLVLCEIRSVAAGNQWLSPFAEDQLALHFSWGTDWAGVKAVLPVLEAALAPFEPRPHWGKLYEMDPVTVRARYPRFDDFVTVADRLDPDHVFRNRHLDHLLG